MINSEFHWSQWRSRGVEDEWKMDDKEMYRSYIVLSIGNKVSEAVIT